MVIICIFVNIGMWFERFVITVTSLSRDYLPSSWGYFSPTIFDGLMFFGSFGVFHVIVPAVLPLFADDCDVGSQGCDVLGCSRKACSGRVTGRSFVWSPPLIVSKADQAKQITYI
jgi:hypothetical protein